jgi:hypothetical protein
MSIDAIEQLRQRMGNATRREAECMAVLLEEEGYLFEPEGYWVVGLIEESAWLELLEESAKMARERACQVFPPVLE